MSLSPTSGSKLTVQRLLGQATRALSLSLPLKTNKLTNKKEFYPFYYFILFTIQTVVNPCPHVRSPFNPMPGYHGNVREENAGCSSNQKRVRNNNNKNSQKCRLTGFPSSTGTPKTTYMAGLSDSESRAHP